jgi:hypothetical protein
VTTTHPVNSTFAETHWERKQRLNWARYAHVADLARSRGEMDEAVVTIRLKNLLRAIPWNPRGDRVRVALWRRAKEQDRGARAVKQELMLSAAILVLARWDEVLCWPFTPSGRIF